ncbi:6-phosphogluconate dehydrogenase [Streptomyces sp. alain-838]|nr:6-phosphogluconate dehydrogenase [Streptomyces sp. alain-838]
MVTRLVEAGHRVRVADRSGRARVALTALGAQSFTDPARAAENADVVALCVYTDEQVREAALESGLLDAMPTGSVLVVHTTGSPATVARLAERSRPRGIEVVDAPISGGPHDIAAGRVTLYAGATEEGLNRARPALRAYGEPILHCGPPGSGQLVKLVNNAVFAANLGVITAAARLAEELGLEEGPVLTGLRHGSGDSRALAGVAARGSAAVFARDVGEFVGKDVAVVREVAWQQGAGLGLLSDAHRVLGDLLAPAHRAQLLGTADAGGH